MTEVKEIDREVVKADLLQRIKRIESEPRDAQEVVRLKEEIQQRETVARRLKNERRLRDIVTRVDLDGAEDRVDLTGATGVHFAQRVRGKDGSIAEERRVAYVRKMENNKPVWVTGKDGSPLSFSDALLDASPVSGAVAQRIDSGPTLAYPLLDKDGSILGAVRVTMPRGPVGK